MAPGLYADIGLNSVKKITAGNIMEYTPEEWSGNQQEHIPAEYRLNSLINTDTRTASVRPVAFGLKLGLAFGCKRHKPVEYVPPVVVEDPVEKARRALAAFVPDVAYIAPAYEEVKTRQESGSSFVDFAINSTDINPDYRNNRAELAKINHTLAAVRSNRFATITGVSVIGYASPEGSYELNTRLAQNRKKTGNFGEVPFSTSSVPEDWEGLERLVAASDLAEKEALLAVIRDREISDYDLREARLRQIADGAPYRELLDRIYPALRRTDYTIDYTIRNFTLEESKALFQSEPKPTSRSTSPGSYSKAIPDS